jgi:formylglycine-generating enzyme required for sulfatase activity
MTQTDSPPFMGGRPQARKTRRLWPWRSWSLLLQSPWQSSPWHLLPWLQAVMLLLVCATSVSAQTGKTLIVRPATGEYAGQTFYTNSFAVIIGISKYQHLPKDKWLNYADKDAADLREVLVRSYGFLPENVTVLLNEQAIKANIEAALSALADINRLHHDDRILVFFSGHGQTVKRANGGDIGFLIPYDANVNLAQIDNPQPYLDTCIKMQQVWDYLDLSPAKHSLLLVDACFGGLLASGKALGARPSPKVVSGLLQRPAQQVMTAGTADQEALELTDKGHGAFAYQLLEELRAQATTPDNVFLASGLYAAVKVPVGNLAAAKGREQTPQMFNYGATTGDFIFVSTSAQTVPPLAMPHVPMREARSVTVPGKVPYLDVKYGMEWVKIPAGEFTMGSTEAEVDAILQSNVNYKREWFAGEIPQHKVNLDTYYIAKNVVTVKQYRQFCTATQREMPPAPTFDPTWSQEDHPMVNVSWNDAVAYCDWLSKEIGQTVTLPTEAQWEKASRGTNGQTYPWGPDFDDSKLWCSVETRRSGTGAVGQYTASPYGLSDMAGNVWQWCADWYDANYYKTSPDRNPAGPPSSPQGYRVLRGGSWNSTRANFFRCANRVRITSVYWLYDVGFRCVVLARP